MAIRPGFLLQTFPSLLRFLQCDTSNKSDCTLYTFSSGVNAIQEWYKLHYMNIMAQIDAEEKERMSYSAEELLLSCFFDGDSCDARSALGQGKARVGTWGASPKREGGRACQSLASSEGRATFALPA